MEALGKPELRHWVRQWRACHWARQQVECGSRQQKVGPILMFPTFTRRGVKKTSCSLFGRLLSGPLYKSCQHYSIETQSHPNLSIFVSNICLFIIGFFESTSVIFLSSTFSRCSHIFLPPSNLKHLQNCFRFLNGLRFFLLYPPCLPTCTTVHSNLLSVSTTT